MTDITRFAITYRKQLQDDLARVEEFLRMSEKLLHAYHASLAGDGTIKAVMPKPNFDRFDEIGATPRPDAKVTPAPHAAAPAAPDPAAAPPAPAPASDPQQRRHLSFRGAFDLPEPRARRDIA